MSATTYQPKRTSPTALAVVVLMHGAALGALAMAKMEVIPNPFKPIKVFPIKDALPPPPDKPEPVEKVATPQQPTQIDTPPPIFHPPIAGPTVADVELPPVKFEPVPPGPIVVPKTDPPLPPKLMELEPARAKANLASYVSDADYPSAAIRNEEQGTTRFRLGVGRDGRVTACTITASSGSSALDATTCKLMKQRARFTPARDSRGNPTTDSFASAIRWVLPD